MAILKIFKPHLVQNGKSDWAKTWWGMGGIRATWRFRIAKNSLLRYPRWPPQQPSWRCSIVSSPWALLQISLCHRLLTMVCHSSVCPSVTFHIFDISIRIVTMIAAVAAILKVFNCYLLPNKVGWSGNLVEGIGAWRFKIAKMVPFWYPRWPPWQSSWKPSNHICSRIVSLIELKRWEALACYGNTELLKSFCSNIQDGRYLEILQTTSPPKQCQTEPKLDGRHRGWHEDSELLKRSWNSSNKIRFWIAKGNLIW